MSAPGPCCCTIASSHPGCDVSLVVAKLRAGTKCHFCSCSFATLCLIRLWWRWVGTKRAAIVLCRQTCSRPSPWGREPLCVLSLHKHGKRQALASGPGGEKQRPCSRSWEATRKKGTSVRRVHAPGGPEEQGWGGADGGRGFGST